MRQFCITVAGVTVEIHHQYDAVRLQCEDYLSDPGAAPRFIAAATQERMAAEMADLQTPIPADMVESLCILRAIAEQMPALGRAVFHGAAIEYKGSGVLFTAPSGTGKSTHIALWRRAFGDDVQIVNGDKPLLWCKEDGVWVCSTPWAGKENWQRNVNVPLRALCLLERGREDTMRPIDPSEVLGRLLSQIYLPRGAEAAAATLELADALLTRIPVFLLSCTPSIHAAEVAFDTLKDLL